MSSPSSKRPAPAVLEFRRKLREDSAAEQRAATAAQRAEDADSDYDDAAEPFAASAEAPPAQGPASFGTQKESC